MALMNTIPDAVVDLAQALAESLAGGQGARRQLGETAGAFGWTAGLPPTVADYVAVTPVAGLSFDAIVCKPTATPAAVVAEGGAKPNAVAFETRPVALAKHAGYAEFTLEQMLRADALAAVIYAVLAGQVLASFERTAMDAIYGGTDETAGGTDLVGSILGAQAAVLGAGGRPGLLIISPTDYAALMGGTVGGYAGPGADPVNGPVGQLFGMVLHVSAAALDGQPVVADPAAITVGQNEKSPSVVIDPFSQSSTNKVRLVLDLLAGAVVTSPASVVKVTGVTPLAATTQSTRSTGGGGTGKAKSAYQLGA